MFKLSTRRINSIMNNRCISESGVRWIKFGTGQIIQWGNQSYSAIRDKTITITYEKPFTSGNFITLTPRATSGDHPAIFASVFSPSNTGFSVRLYGSNSSDTNIGFNWIATGGA